MWHITRYRAERLALYKRIRLVASALGSAHLPMLRIYVREASRTKVVSDRDVIAVFTVWKMAMRDRRRIMKLPRQTRYKILAEQCAHFRDWINEGRELPHG